MCDDFYDDFDGDYDGEPEDACPAPDADDGFRDGPVWQDWMIIGPLSEEIAREKRERERIRRENNEDDCNYWDIVERRL